MTRRSVRAANWSPLSPDARALIAEPERDGLAWGYVSLWDGAAAQRCAFGVAARPADLLTPLEPQPAPEPDRCQGELFPT